MAWARPLDQQCTEAACTARATFEVRNNRNEVVRVCCRRHADALVRRLSDDEAGR